MKPLDPRLLRYASAARGVFATGAALGLLRTVAIVAWCWFLAQALAVLVLPVLGGPAGGGADGGGADGGGAGGAAGLTGRVAEGVQDPDRLPWLLVLAGAAVAVRALSGWGMDVVAARGAIRAKTQLRSRALDAIDGRSPEWAAIRADAGTATVLGRGLDALDGYFSGYVPQLILTACSTPILILVVMLADPVSGITVIVVFPVIPLFMILIGLATQAVQDRQWQQLQRLSSSFLDVVTGLPTLKIFRREERQALRIARETDEYRSRTMRVLRVTFLSGFVLDLAGTFSIALVAVTVGTRLVSGEFPLALGLFVLLLLPEVFIPIRQVGAAFHASTEGLAASQQVFEIIEEESEEAPAGGTRGENAGGEGARDEEARREAERISFDDAVFVRGGRPVVGPVSFEVRRGEVVALAGQSGAGKSTLIAGLLGFTRPETGSVSRPSELAWAGQRPGLLQGTIADNVALGASGPDLELVRRALDATGLGEIGPGRVLGAGGSGLSGGQAQRVGIARCLYRAWSVDAGAVVLDEPTSALDAATEARIGAALRREAEAGRAVLVVSHREALIESADRVVRVGEES